MVAGRSTFGCEALTHFFASVLVLLRVFFRPSISVQQGSTGGLRGSGVCDSVVDQILSQKASPPAAVISVYWSKTGFMSEFKNSNNYVILVWSFYRILTAENPGTVN
jgi:hypothetical protein